MRIVAVILGVLVLAVGYLSYLKTHGAPLVRIQPPPGEEQATPVELGRFWAIPDFALTDRSGKAVTLNDLRGKIWVADFVYTTCPGPCPMLSSRMAEIQKEVAFAPDVRLVSISTDPASDTPAVLETYAQRFHATDRWLFLTGDKAQIYALANQGFKLSVTEDRNSPEPITHSTKLVLIDRQGIVRGFYDGMDAKTGERLVNDIRKLLGEKL
jgi:protein SCO1/2